jgi:hypothetical protein
MNCAERAQFEAALARMVEGEPEPGDGESLARAMREDAALRREVSGIFVVDDLLRQHAELSAEDFAEAFVERLADDADVEFADRVKGALPIPVPFWQHRGWRMAAAVAVMLGLGALAFSFAPRPRIEIATLLLAEKCEWQDGAPVQEGRRLSAGPLRLRSGLAVLRLDGGAELILRSGTEVELQSDAEARLVRGEVTVRAAEEAAGFKLQTPASEMVDLGTEFAAKVEASGATELHVIEGEVALKAGQIIHAGHAVRYDSPNTAAPRTVPLRAESFEEIVRAAQPAARSELMLAYEGFLYRPGRLPLVAADGGLGWTGPWRAAGKSEAYRAIEDPVGDLSITTDDASMPWPLPRGQPGRLELPAGTRSVARSLARPIALDRDGVTYFSVVVREPAPADPAVRSFAGVRLVFRSAAHPAAGMLSFGPNRAGRHPGIRTGTRKNFTSPVHIAANQHTLWIGKIIARRDGEDEVFFSIYGEQDTFGFVEPATWQVASRGLRGSGQLDVVVIATQLSAACSVDELRIGPTWRSIAPMQELTLDRR